MSSLRNWKTPAVGMLFALTIPITALAQAAAAPIEERLAKMEGAASAAQSAGDNAWMLVCSALVR
jgi:Amt family ammonium transporter